MGLLEYKDFGGAIIDVDTASRRVVANWSGLGNKDFDNDIIHKTAYDKTIQERGPKGKNLIYWIVDHNPSVKNIAGSVTELSVVGNHLQAVKQASDTTLGNDLLKLYQDGIIKQHSVGFSAVDTEQFKDYRLIKQIQLYEGSSVLWGANEDTYTVSVSKSLISNPTDVMQELDNLLKAFRSGTYTDETFGLLELRIKTIQKAISGFLLPANGSHESGSHVGSTDSDAKNINLLEDLKKSLTWN
ncbi:HK97 family phage prohead protease [Sphingobacterium sp. UBA6645]|uniref:HK97 family phage prohead protease n=1 Tax=Sphingobacterium sp. UBA6645 TaxID=1947511 RepID=UPI0025D857E2|nr:HK97 family phage prohead protease [Sphingobacterium sp. UBA6645]